METGGSRTRGQPGGVEETENSAGRGEEERRHWSGGVLGLGPGPTGAIYKLGRAASRARLLHA